jgi:hypothetical protein
VHGREEGRPGKEEREEGESFMASKGVSRGFFSASRASRRWQRWPPERAGGVVGGLLGASTHLLEVEDKREVLLIAPWAFEIPREVENCTSLQCLMI